ncbi:helix-turn-helix domain-containing protein [Mycolicibacter terrae]|uniref:Helix-turn-helix domain-containing protein n=1 Tax=Mycolicibacter terrae TaxID=1788 RepID=A0ACD2EIF0_9MYCO|nr:helix-turn-helix domain-containing protein [Mycolicibacter terrae]RRR41156.1 helix-turn-helix domain-containing protein [Mycolicibacter terrae]
MAEFSKLTWLKSVAGADLTDGEYRVLIAIFNHTDESGRRCYAKQSTLAAETRKSDRQIRRIIPELVRKGWLKEVRKGAGRAGMSSEFDLSTPEYRTPMSGISDPAPGEIPDIHDRYSEGIPDISGMNTGHLGHKYRTPVTGIPDTHVRPSDPYQIRPSEPDQIRGPVAPSDPLTEASIATGDDRQRGPVTEVSSDLGASAGRYTGAQEAPGDRPESETESVSSSVLAVAEGNPEEGSRGDQPEFSGPSEEDLAVAVEATENVSRFSAEPKSSPAEAWGIKPVQTLPRAHLGPDPFAVAEPQSTDPFAPNFVPAS